MATLTLNTLLAIQSPTPESAADDQKRPLCDNIFDVPRHDLLESYERLRRAFWYGPATVTRRPKRRSRDDQESSAEAAESKRARLYERTPSSSSRQREQSGLSFSSSSSSSSSWSSLSFQPFSEEPSPRAAEVSTQAAAAIKQRQQKTVAKNPFMSSVSPSLVTLWPLKRDLLRQLRNNDGNVPVIEEIDRICDAPQKAHLAKYIEPFLAPSSPVRQHMQKWL